jgi:phospholipid/cholesterol/gamma-HCH transport system ATP-binding protein
MAAIELIKIENLSKRFGEKVILDNISLSVMQGENLVVFGRSGTGKSVLLKCIMGLLEPDNGKIFIKGKEITNISTKELNKIRRNTGFLFQGAALYDSMTVRENLEFTLKRNRDISDKEAYEKVLNTLDLVSLKGCS